MSNCAITGAKGYLGSQLVAYLRASDVNVVELSRDVPYDDLHVPFSYQDIPQPVEFQKRHIEILIHCAYDFTVRGWSNIQKRNVEGSAKLFAAAKSGGVQRIICISSQSAYRGCRSLYGRAKWEIEQRALAAGAIVIRPGLIYGRNPGGTVGALMKSLSRAMVPVIVHPGSSLHLIHQDDLCEMIYQAATQSGLNPGKPVVAASQRGWSLGAILKALAERSGRRIMALPVPWRLAWLGLVSLEILGFQGDFRSDSLLTLGYPTPDPEFDAVRLPQFRIREFPEGL